MMLVIVALEASQKQSNCQQNELWSNKGVASVAFQLGGEDCCGYEWCRVIVVQLTVLNEIQIGYSTHRNV